MIKIVTGPNLEKMGDVTADGNMCACAKQNTLFYSNGTPIPSMMMIAFIITLGETM